METKEPDYNASMEQSVPTPSEPDETLYLGTVSLIEGLVGSREVRFWGQMAFHGRPDENGDLKVVGIDRLVLSETLKPPNNSDEFQALSLTGPLEEIRLPAKSDQTPVKLPMQLEYLGMEEQRREKGEEYTFPEVEAMLSYSVAAISDRGHVTLAITLESTSVTTNDGWDEVPMVKIETEATVVFQPVTYVEPEYREIPPPSGNFENLFSYIHSGCTQVQEMPSGWHNKLDVVYELNVIFLLFSEDKNPGDVRDLCKTQLAHACEVWWDLCGLKIVAWSTRPGNNSDQPEIFVGDKTKAKTLGGNNEDQDFLNKFSQDFTDPISCVEVCLVDTIIPDPQKPHQLPAGLTFPRTGANNGYCLLEIEQAKNADYLLAHELGHALGLDDAHAQGKFAGSGDSIMDVEYVKNPTNPVPDNTALNCKLYMRGRKRYGKVVVMTGNAGWFFTVDQIPVP